MLAAGFATVAFCATLPDTERKMTQAHDPQVVIEGPQGALSAAGSDALLARLEGRSGASGLLQKHLAFEQAVNADSPLVLGNKLTLLQNGPETYESMFAAIRSAEDHINLETYIFSDDDVGRQFAELLLERQAAGIQVNIIYDSVGGMTTPEAFFERLRAGGIHVLEFNPVNPLTKNRKTWLLNNRDHRKQLIVDGRIAFVGGINISETYASAPLTRRARKERKRMAAAAGHGGWRDTHIRLEGPVVAQFQQLFLETWAQQAGKPLRAAKHFPELTAQGDEVVRAIGSSPDDAYSLIYLTLLSAINNAEMEVHLTIAYFAPDPQLLDALTSAAKRGVDVKLILPGKTDSWAIFHLGRSYYTKLLRSGVRIYERSGAVMHAKSACIDGVWSTIGSTNLDWRSFLHNTEVNAVILGVNFAGEMGAMFAEDLAESEEILLEQWRHRSWLLKVQERFARLGAYWL
jgi:cardiolipin synthase A/B